MNKIMSSSILLVIQKIAERSLGIISTLILARILTPEDFGLVAKAMLVLWFVQSIAAAGTESYILQKESVSDSDLNTAWTLNFILKILAYLVLLVLAVIYKLITEDYQVFLIICVLGFVLVINSFKNPGLLNFKRSQNYGKIVYISVLGKFAAVFIVVPAALILQNHWAIVIGQFVLSVVGLVLSYVICDFRPRFCTENIRQQWEFSKWLIPQEMVGYFRNHIDTVVVGSKFTAGELGAYNNMKYFSSMPMLQLITPAAEPLHAELGKVQRNPGEMKFQVDFSTFVLAFMIAPITIMLLFGSEQIIALILGQQWVPYHEIFAVLSLSTLPLVLISQANRLLMIRGKTNFIMFFEVAITVSILCMVILFQFDQVQLLALVKVAVEFLFAIIYFAFAYRYSLNVNPSRPLMLFVYPTFIIGFVTFLASSYINEFQTGLLQLIFLACFISVFTFVLMFVHYFFALKVRERILIRKILRISGD